MSTSLQPKRRADDVTALRVMTEEMRPLLVGDGYQMFDVRAPQSSGPPPHQHPWDESYVVLEGELWVSRGGEEATLQVGEAIRVPAGVVHAYRVLSDGARWITTSSCPGGALDFFSDVDETSNGPGDVKALIEAAKRNSVRFADPALG
ncbi:MULTISPECIES: cupin domain-containing protein [Mycobacteriaceae]|uniref:Cupin n=11 Tax=Mycobacteriaceae TaxID=1762 RepID=A0AAW5STH6_MYCNV|nr:Cupin 2, conserved barrel domain protein [Mycolicibacterium gilvum PYR-GCK]APE17876.1 cupin [Mycobacterium sp. WY10]MBV5247106.1 cupin domain-containing protein [Mycolicibacterium sp. PAM1]MCV7027569.1 cupin domain-containing protein [Mycolicibacterium novocastrense]MCV7283709.1 cupin domain-containing protein [Mycolicibacterium flavescens]MDA4103583.1 cupin [Mycolicibacterium monacense DSM 44395]ORA60474.1 cupin [Mycolicibacterium elephantis]QIV80619.1 cupin domain-containing protein [My